MRLLVVIGMHILLFKSYVASLSDEGDVYLRLDNGISPSLFIF